MPTQLGRLCGAVMVFTAMTAPVLRAQDGTGGGAGGGAITLTVARLELGASATGSLLKPVYLIGTNGVRVTMPGGTFSGPGGASLEISSGVIARFKPSGKLPAQAIASVRIKDGQLGLIGTNGMVYYLPAGTFVTAAGTSVVVQNRTISRVEMAK